MNQNLAKFTAFAAIIAVGFSSCKKDTQDAQSQETISAETRAKIKDMGFSTSGMQKVDEGYLVEGDIILTEENLQYPASSPNLLIASVEQYRTNNLVTRLPRTITVSVSNLPTVYSDAANKAIAQYNGLTGTQLIFTRAATGTRADIDIVGFNQAPSGGYITLGSSGFPTRKGDPYSQIKMNTNQYAYGTNPNVDYVASVLLHEIGHCIGFRHTDYYDRSISCGGAYSNEGASNVGAILIPGTPSKADGTSFMMACSDGTNRTFNANDKTAMAYLY